MRRKLAFVLSGGGSRGALQVGALRAIYETGLKPDILVGTSVGACNAAFLALHGFDLESLKRLELVWQDAGSANLLPNNFLWMTVRTIFNRRTPNYTNQLRNFLVAHGLDPNLTFQDLKSCQLYLVAADINQGKMVLFGQDPLQSILEGVIASAALPPWITPLVNGEQLLVDGGVISNLPILAAMQAGAEEIIALDLEPPMNQAESQGIGPFMSKVMGTVHRHQNDLELAFAREKNIPVCHVRLCDANVPIWDFSHSDEMFAVGYSKAKESLDLWIRTQRPLSWSERLSQKFEIFKKRS